MKTKNIILVFMMSIAMVSAFAQQKKKGETSAEPLKIIFQMTTDDTLAHKALMKQLSNIISVEPDVQIEVVCHGPGLSMLQKSKSRFQSRIADFASRGITFSACEFSMSERNVPREDILEMVVFVKAGIVHIVKKQKENWSYIKAGF